MRLDGPVSCMAAVQGLAPLLRLMDAVTLHGLDAGYQASRVLEAQVRCALVSL